MSETQTTTLVERLEAVGCDREPFTPDHKNCICRLTNEAAREISKLTSQLEGARKGCLDGVTGTSIDPERPSCLLVHFDHDVTEDDRERIRSAHNSVVTLRAQLEEARAKAIEECAAILDEDAQELNRQRDPGMANFCRAKSRKLRALIAGSTT